jgi:hypothetical protein
MARTGDQRCAAIGCCAGCKHIPTSGAIGVLGAIAKHDSVPAEVVALQTLNPHAFSHWARNIFYNEQALAGAVAGDYPAPSYRVVLFNNLPNSTRRVIATLA